MVWHGPSERELEDILDPWEDLTCSGPHLLPSEPAEDAPGEALPDAWCWKRGSGNNDPSEGVRDMPQELQNLAFKVTWVYGKDGPLTIAELREVLEAQRSGTVTV